jgi:hypothetical protein
MAMPWWTGWIVGEGHFPMKSANYSSRVDKMNGTSSTGAAATIAVTNTKNTPFNGSQTDSGVFTLGSSSAMAANSVAMNGMGGHKANGGGANQMMMAGMCADHAK